MRSQVSPISADPPKDTFTRIIPFLRPFRWHIIGLVSMTAVLSVLAMLPPLLTRAVINRVIGDGEHDLLPMLAVAMGVVPMLHATTSYLQTRGVALVGQTFVMKVRTAVYRHLLLLSMAFYGRTGTGKLINRLMGDSTVLQKMLTVASVQIVSDLVCSTFAVTAAVVLNWRLAMPLIITVVLFVVNYRLSIGRIRRATRSYRGAEDRVASGVQSRLVANLTVKTFGAEERENDIFRDQSAASLDLVRQSKVATTDFTLNTMLLRDLGRTTVYFLGCAMVLSDTASYGDVVAFTAYAVQMLMPAVRFSMIAQQLQEVRISADRLFEILDEVPEIENPPNGRKLTACRGQIDLNHVDFAYEPGRPVLQDVDFHVAPGETVALVGPTGCGKTTILSLLMRLFDVADGSIQIDGIDLRELDLGSFRNAFGIVLQESHLFTVSIADNIRYARQDATREQIEHAARVAEIHEDILALPDGYDSIAGNRDVQLSVGQRQRISIARAVLANPAILIMDEATSALDSESERAIQQAMDRFLEGRTSFIVAHRLSTVRNADRIILLDGGHIVEMGNHAALMAIPDGRYRELYDKHAGKGVLSDE